MDLPGNTVSVINLSKHGPIHASKIVDSCVVEKLVPLQVAYPHFFRVKQKLFSWSEEKWWGNTFCPKAKGFCHIQHGDIAGIIVYRIILDNTRLKGRLLNTITKLKMIEIAFS